MERTGDHVPPAVQPKSAEHGRGRHHRRLPRRRCAGAVDRAVPVRRLRHRSPAQSAVLDPSHGHGPVRPRHRCRGSSTARGSRSPLRSRRPSSGRSSGSPSAPSRGFVSGWVDEVAMRSMDVILAFPPIVLALAMAALLEPSLQNVILIIGFLIIPQFARVTRGSVLAVMNQEYVTASRVVGQRERGILLRHILPNTVGSARRPCVSHDPRRHPDGGRAQLPRRGRPAADPELGQHDRGWQLIPATGTVVDGVPGARHQHLRAWFQPCRRWPSGRTRYLDACDLTRTRRVGALPPFRALLRCMRFSQAAVPGAAATGRGPSRRPGSGRPPRRTRRRRAQAPSGRRRAVRRVRGAPEPMFTPASPSSETDPAHRAGPVAVMCDRASRRDGGTIDVEPAEARQARLAVRDRAGDRGRGVHEDVTTGPPSRASRRPGSSRRARR